MSPTTPPKASGSRRWPPSTAACPTPAEAQNLASWAKAYGPGGTYWANHSGGNLAFQTIEFGNETSYGYQYGDNAGTPSYQARAQTYAVRLKEASEAIAATGAKVGVLAQADDPSGNWVNGMYQAVPNLANYVSGWVVHPYGTSGKGKIAGLLQQTAAHGAPSNIPVDITEWGLSTDNGVCVYENYGLNPCMTYAEAGEQLKKSVAEIKSLVGSRLQLFLLYQVRDQESRWREQRPRGVLRAAPARRPAEGRLHHRGAGTPRDLMIESRGRGSTPASGKPHARAPVAATAAGAPWFCASARRAVRCSGCRSA